MRGGGWRSLGAGITNSDSGALPGLPSVLLERGPREGKKPQLRVPKAKGAQGILPTQPLACECPCVSVSVCPYIPRDGFCVSVAIYACVWISMCLRVCEGVRLCMSPCESSVLVILSISVVRFDKIPLSLSPSLSLSLLSTCYSLRKEKKKVPPLCLEHLPLKSLWLQLVTYPLGGGHVYPNQHRFGAGRWGTLNAGVEGQRSGKQLQRFR